LPRGTEIVLAAHSWLLVSPSFRMSAAYSLKTPPLNIQLASIVHPDLDEEVEIVQPSLHVHAMLK